MEQAILGEPSVSNDHAINFERLNHIATLDPRFLPGSTSHSHTEDESRNRRLIFIGDIHGCLDELQALLTKVEYNPAHDHIVALGDIINKGPNSREVVDLLMKQGASCVRGNHEDEILNAAKVLLSSKGSPISLDQPNGDENLGKETSKLKQRKSAAQELARTFNFIQLRWLQDCPIILQVGEVKPFGNIVAVHGGLVPGIPLEKQDPQAVMNMRIIDVDTLTPSKKHSAKGSELWFNVWHKYQDNLPRHEKRTTVVYGHDKKKGAQIHRFTKGLDTGCYDGGKLTAWVVRFNKNDIVHVKSKQNIKEKD